MLIECCSQERSYSNFYGLVGERFCKLNRVWTECVETAFSNYYDTIHRYETNRLRNISRFFGHILATDSISWAVFECVKINEDDTTSSSRIFIKILMNEMMESMGLKTMAERFKDEEVKRHCAGMFPMDIPKNTRFAINYFTSIGLGIVTEEMREWLKVRFTKSIFTSLEVTSYDFATSECPKTHYGTTKSDVGSSLVVVRHVIGLRLWFRFRNIFRFVWFL
jgi:pre-mRNA-splicing factor CWC22